MTPLVLFLLGCAAVYLGTIEAAFSALMHLPLRLAAERSDRPDRLGVYLDDPLLLFVPVRLLLGLVTACATAFVAHGVGVEGTHTLTVAVLAALSFVVAFEVLLPLAIVGHDPERVLALLLPSFEPVARLLAPVVNWMARSVVARQDRGPVASSEDQADESGEPGRGATDHQEAEGLIESEERRLLQSIVDFGDTLVREVMTPRPDIVAIREDSTVADLRTLFKEQEYSRFPVYKENLDNIAGILFVKDLVTLGSGSDGRLLRSLARPAVVVPETKRVPELLKQFQRQQVQMAIVVDEYGGTAGLVTLEDLLEEIVGEIRDEYDQESEPVVEEAPGRYLFSGKVHVDEVAERLGVSIEGEGFETVGGLLLSHLGRVPAAGEQMEVGALHIEVVDAERRRVNKVRISRLVPVDAVEESA